MMPASVMKAELKEGRLRLAAESTRVMVLLKRVVEQDAKIEEERAQIAVLVQACEELLPPQEEFPLSNDIYARYDAVLVDEGLAEARALLAERDAALARISTLEGNMCLICGRQEPCELDKRENSPDPDNWPGSPCTFDKTPQELNQLLQEALAREKVLRDALMRFECQPSCDSCAEERPIILAGDRQMTKSLKDTFPLTKFDYEIQKKEMDRRIQELAAKLALFDEAVAALRECVDGLEFFTDPRKSTGSVMHVLKNALPAAQAVLTKAEAMKEQTESDVSASR